MRKKIVIIGFAPLPHEDPARLYAGSIRTDAFCQVLKRDNDVMLLGMRIPGSYDKEKELPVIINDKSQGFDYFSINDKHFGEIKKREELAKNFSPDIIVGVNSLPSYYAAMLNLRIPFWADLNGSLLCEFQLKASAEKDEYYTWHFFGIERAIIKTADKFSVVSEYQKYELIGELASIKRINAVNSFYDFVHVIQNPVMPMNYEHKKNVFRGKIIPEDAFVVLWTGGYNYWTDVKLLFNGITAAMKRNSKIYFVSLGGGIQAHNNKTFNNFLKLINDSDIKNRFHFAGWVKTSEVPDYYFESDIGINIDGYSYETFTGGRNRINDMMNAGLPVLTTEGPEITKIIKDKDLGFTFKIGDVNGFTDKLLKLAKMSKTDLKEKGFRSKNFAKENWNYEKILSEFLLWLKDPQKSPDNLLKRYFKRKDYLNNIIEFLVTAKNPSLFMKRFKEKMRAFTDA